MADTIDQVLHRPVPPLEEIPDSLSEPVMRMLERDRNNRFADHCETRDALRETLAKENTPVTTSEIAQWMTSIFPNAAIEEEAQADHELHRVLISAEEMGFDTTDMSGEVTSATEIYVSDNTTQADYREALERFMHARQNETQSRSISGDASSEPLSLEGVWSDAAWAVSLVSMGYFLFLILL